MSKMNNMKYPLCAQCDLAIQNNPKIQYEVITLHLLNEVIVLHR